jgi:hypothetical protein
MDRLVRDHKGEGREQKMVRAVDERDHYHHFHQLLAVLSRAAERGRWC